MFYSHSPTKTAHEARRTEAARKLFELVRSGQAARGAPSLSRTEPPPPRCTGTGTGGKLLHEALRTFVLHFEQLQRRQRLEQTRAFFKHQKCRFPFRISLINEKFRLCVQKHGHKTKLVVKGFRYTAFLRGVEMWTLNRGIIFELGFVPARVACLTLGLVGKDDLNNLDEMCYMFENIEQLAIPLIPASNPLGLEFVRAFRHTLSVLDCSALLLRSHVMHKMFLRELRCTNVSWVDDLTYILGLRADRISLNALPTIPTILSGGLDEVPHARLLHLCLLNCPALRLEQVTLLLTSLCRCLPRIRRLDLQCVPVIAGPMPFDLRLFPQICAEGVRIVGRALRMSRFFEVAVWMRSANIDVLQTAVLEQQLIGVDADPLRGVEKRLTYTTTFENCRMLYIVELVSPSSLNY